MVFAFVDKECRCRFWLRNVKNPSVTTSFSGFWKLLENCENEKVRKRNHPHVRPRVMVYILSGRLLPIVENKSTRYTPLTNARLFCSPDQGWKGSYTNLKRPIWEKAADESKNTVFPFMPIYSFKEQCFFVGHMLFAFFCIDEHS